MEINWTDQVTINLKGSSSILTGSNNIRKLTGNVQGSGKVNGSNCVENMMANVMGSGKIVGLHVNNMLNANVMGNGNVSVKCGPNCNVSKSVMGSGSVNIY